jgi:HTH-type transcriptional regulator, competence development regulator
VPTELGVKLAAARTARGWSLREVERRTGIHNAHLSQIETGTIERPDLGMLWELAQLYELDYDELLLFAGHTKSRSSSQAQTAAAFRAFERLTPDQQREALRFMDELRRQQGDE